MKYQKGFTAFEIMIACSILGILVLIGVPHYFGSLKKAKFNEVMTQIEALKLQINICAQIEHDLTQCIPGQNGVQADMGSLGSTTPVSGLSTTAWVAVGAPAGYDHAGGTTLVAPPPVPPATIAPVMKYGTTQINGTNQAYKVFSATRPTSPEEACALLPLVNKTVVQYNAAGTSFSSVTQAATSVQYNAASQSCEFSTATATGYGFGLPRNNLRRVNDIHRVLMIPECPPGYAVIGATSTWTRRDFPVDSPFTATQFYQQYSTAGQTCTLSDVLVAQAAMTPPPLPPIAPTTTTTNIFAATTSGKDVQLKGTMGPDFVMSWQVNAYSSCMTDGSCNIKQYDTTANN